jgi:hypothetical protein
MHFGLSSRAGLRRHSLAIAAVAAFACGMLSASAQADVVTPHVVTPQVVTPAPIASPAPTPAPAPTAAPQSTPNPAGTGPGDEPYEPLPPKPVPNPYDPKPPPDPRPSSEPPDTAPCNVRVGNSTHCPCDPALCYWRRSGLAWSEYDRAIFQRDQGFRALVTMTKAVMEVVGAFGKEFKESFFPDRPLADFHPPGAPVDTSGGRGGAPAPVGPTTSEAEEDCQCSLGEGGQAGAGGRSWIDEGDETEEK